MMTGPGFLLNFNSKSKYCAVEQRGDTTALRIVPEKNITYNWIEPAIATINYLPDSFTLEYDFLLETKSATCNLYLKYCDKYLCELFYIYNKGNYNFTFVNGGYRDF